MSDIPFVACVALLADVARLRVCLYWLPAPVSACVCLPSTASLCNFRLELKEVGCTCPRMDFRRTFPLTSRVEYLGLLTIAELLHHPSLHSTYVCFRDTQWYSTYE